MNLYFLLEGDRTEKLLYRSWLAHAFPALRVVDRPEEVTEGCVRIIAGGGYPQYLRRIAEVLGEIALVRHRVDHFFVCTDAEEQSLAERRDEIAARISEKAPQVPWSVIVQDCCIETWLLGNRRFLKRRPQSEKLREYQRFYHVGKRDPESMEAMDPHRLRAPFHLAYLREMFRERRLAYSKKRPGEATAPAYLQALVERHDVTRHLLSFGRLVAEWRKLGAAI